MKKILIAAVVALMSFTAMSAQERMSEEERAKAIAERIEKAAERMAKDFDLKDEAKASFIETYKSYQTEMFATNQPQGQREEPQADQKEKKELTEAEATAKLQENFDRQQKQIETMQTRLEVQKKYAAEFGKTLTPQQVLKIMTPQQRGGQQRGQRQGDGQGQGNFQGRGGFGGPRGGFGGPGFGGPGF